MRGATARDDRLGLAGQPANGSGARPLPSPRAPYHSAARASGSRSSLVMCPPRTEIKPLQGPGS